MKHANFICPKCGHNHYGIGKIWATVGILPKNFDVQNKKFTLVTCSHFTYTEFYKAKTSTLSHVLDLFTN